MEKITKLTKAELQKMYDTMKNKDIAEKLGVSLPTLTSLLKKAGIKMKGRGKGSQKIELVK